MKYQKKNTKILVEAQVVTEEAGWDLEAWCQGRFTAFSGVAYLNVPTVNGIVRAYADDYLVQDALGKFTVVDKQTFEADYEATT
jgi:hypothetical protein